MTGNPVASINAQLGIDSTQFNTGLAQANDKLKAFGGSLQSSLGNVDFGKALDDFFDSSRLAVLDAGTEKFKLLGSALEPLGPYGVAAGAALAAIGVGVEQAVKALELTKDLQDTATKLGITTTELQEYDFAALKAGVSTQEFRAAIAAGTQSFGAFISGVGDTKVKQAFAAIGFTQAQAKSLGDFSTALPVIADRIKDVGNAAEQAKIVESLTHSGALLPTLEQGKQGLIDTADEAHNLGLVIDADLIKRGAEASEQFEIATKIIGTDLKLAFLGLAPAIIEVAQDIAQATQKLVDFLDVYKQVQDRSTHGLASEAAAGRRDAESYKTVAQLGGATMGANGQMTGGVWGLAGAYNNAVAKAEEKEEVVQQRGYDDEEDKAYRSRLARESAKTLATPPGRKVANHSAEDQKQADTAVDTANKNLATALANLTDDINLRAQFEKDAVDAETKKLTAALVEDEAKNNKDVTSGALTAAKRDQLNAELELAKTTEMKAANAKKDLIDRKAQQELATQALDYQITMDGYDQSILKSQASIATDANARAELEIQAFRDAQSDARAKLTDTLQDKVDNHGMSADAMQAQLEKFQQDQSAALVAERSQQLRSANPLYAMANPLTSVNDNLQTIAADGLKNVNDELAKAITGTESLGDAFHNISLQILSDLAKLAIEKAITEPLAGVLGSLFSPIGNIFNTAGTVGIGSVLSSLNMGSGAGLSSLVGGKTYAVGTDDAPGGLSLVGEHGPELMNIPAGSQVVPNDRLSALASSPMASNDDMGPRGFQVEIVDTTGLFKTRVTDIAAPLAAQAGATAVAVGSASAQTSASRQAANTLGRRR